MLERLNVPGNFHSAPYCHACRAGNFLYLTGQMPVDPVTGEYVRGDIEAQTRRVLDNLLLVLDYANFTLADVVAARAFLTDFSRDYDDFNRVYLEYMGDHLPTRTTVGVAGLAAECNVEVDFVAYRD